MFKRVGVQIQNFAVAILVLSILLGAFLGGIVGLLLAMLYGVFGFAFFVMGVGIGSGLGWLMGWVVSKFMYAFGEITENVDKLSYNVYCILLNQANDMSTKTAASCSAHTNGTWNCPACGALNNPEGIFCRECGKPRG